MNKLWIVIHQTKSNLERASFETLSGSGDPLGKPLKHSAQNICSVFFLNRKTLKYQKVSRYSQIALHCLQFWTLGPTN